MHNFNSILTVYLNQFIYYKERLAVNVYNLLSTLCYGSYKILLRLHLLDFHQLIFLGMNGPVTCIMPNHQVIAYYLFNWHHSGERVMYMGPFFTGSSWSINIHLLGWLRGNCENGWSHVLLNQHFKLFALLYFSSCLLHVTLQYLTFTQKLYLYYAISKCTHTTFHFSM